MSRREAELVNEAVIADGLRELTRLLMERGYPTSGGLLGGEYGYGVYFEDETFMMHPYCWCEEADCPWCDPCFCPDGTTSYTVDGKVVEDFESWLEAPHASRGVSVNREMQCERCQTDRKAAANFLHKPSGTQVRWYKYIGRGMEIELHGDWESIINQCAHTVLSAPPFVDATTRDGQLPLREAEAAGPSKKSLERGEHYV